ncbi:MAG: HD-GYP domain-containing protein [Bacillota bacterium]
MRLIPTEKVEPGTRLGRSVYDQTGRLILVAGVTLTRRYLEMLLKQGYTFLYVADSIDEVELPETVRLDTRREVVRYVNDFARCHTPGDVRQARGAFTSQMNPGMAASVRKAVDLLVNEILSSREVVIGLVDIKSLHDHSFRHSVQVALMSIVVGKIMGLTRNELRELGTGTLLHDMGKLKIPDSIWNKKEELTAEEIQQIKRHPQEGYGILRNANVGLLAAHVAFQHHERYNGTGYPRGLVGEEIARYARICAVCDVFDAITSDRPYKPAAHPCEALSFIQKNAGALFDPVVVEAFLALVAPYPVATNVLLSTGEVAVVKRLNIQALARPVVMVTKNRERRFMAAFTEIDLSKVDSVSIVDYVNWYDEARHQTVRPYELSSCKRQSRA